MLYTEALLYAGYCCAVCNDVEFTTDGFAIARAESNIGDEFTAVFDIEDDEFLLDHIMFCYNGHELYDSRFDDEFTEDDARLITDTLDDVLRDKRREEGLL